MVVTAYRTVLTLDNLVLFSPKTSFTQNSTPIRELIVSSIPQLKKSATSIWRTHSCARLTSGTNLKLIVQQWYQNQPEGSNRKKIFFTVLTVCTFSLGFALNWLCQPTKTARI